MRIISFGELYVDYYFNNGTFLGINGGKSNANILANLSNKYDTAFIGTVGNDSQGLVALNSLKNLNVDISNVKVLNENTNILFYNKNSATNKCPYCDRLININKHNIEDLVLSNIREDDLIVIDNIDEDTINILNKVNNKAYLNLTYLGEYLYLSLDELVSLLKDKFEIINIDEAVYNLIKKKYMLDSIDLYELINPVILIIDRKIKGVDIIHDGILYKKEVEEVIKNETDIIGVQDSFFAHMIDYFIKENDINEKTISSAYIYSISNSNYINKFVGGRNHLIKNKKINNYHECICKEIELDL